MCAYIQLYRCCQTFFQSGYTILCFYVQCVSLGCSKSSPTLEILTFFILAILVFVAWHLFVVSLYIHMMTNEVEHLLYKFIGHLEIFDNVSVQDFCSFFSICLLSLICKGYIYIFWVYLSNICIVNIFLQSS